MFKIRELVLSLIMAAVPQMAIGAGTVSGTVHVVDGDTLEVGGRQVRLLGIDAPEAAQRLALKTGGTDFLGRGAGMMLRSLITENEIRCELSDQSDGRGLPLAKCFNETLDLGGEMVATGMAWATRSYPSPYTEAEAKARSLKKGFWRDDNETPWSFRQRRRQAFVTASPGGCVFKAVNDGGRKTLIAPWSPWYKDVKVNLKNGDRWFCTEPEAVAQGWFEPTWLIESVVSGVYNPSN